MKTIFVVMQCWNDYDDAGATPIIATFDEKIAEEKVAEMLVRKEARQGVYDSIQNHMAEWEKVNPRPRIPKHTPKPLPNFGPKKKWTEKQKAEYAAVKDANEKMVREEVNPFHVWAQIRFQELKTFTETFTKDEQDDYTQLNEKLYWEIESVPYVE